MKILFVILVCMLCILVAFLSAFLATPVVANSEYIQDANEPLWFDYDPNIIFVISNEIGWESGPYVVDPNNLPWDITCCDPNGEITILEMKADGDLYLSGSFEQFVKCIYESMVLDGRTFQGEVIQETTKIKE